MHALHALALVLALAPIWLVQRDLWDGSIGAWGLDRHDLGPVQDWLLPGNWGLMYLMFVGIAWVQDAGGVPHWVQVKLILTASLAGISLEAARLARDLLRWPAVDCQAVAVLAAVFPCWYLLQGSTFIYIVFIWACLLGHRWLHAARGLTPRVLAGGMLVLLSFQVNSNFVMIFALEGARWLCRDRAEPWSWMRSAFVAAAAIGVYLVLRGVFAPSGQYSGYNNLILPFDREGLIAWTRAVLMFLTWVPLLCAGGLAAWLASRGSARRQAAHVPLRDHAAVAVLITGATVAYMAVGKGAPLFVVNLPLQWLGAGQHMGRETTDWIFTTVHGWSTRHVFLMSVPAALLSQHLIRWASGADASGRSWRVGLAVMVAAHAVWMLAGHGAKHQRLATEQSIVLAMQRLGPPAPGRLDIELRQPLRWTLLPYETHYLGWIAWRRSDWAIAIHGPSAQDRALALATREQALADHAAGRRDLLMDSPAHAACQTVWQLDVPDARPWAWLGSVTGIRALPPAVLVRQASDCPAAGAHSQPATADQPR